MSADSERAFLRAIKAEDDARMWERRARSMGWREPASFAPPPESAPPLTVMPDVCPAGWAATPSSPSCNYTGGHYCIHPPHDGGAHLCPCGATTTAKSAMPKDEDR